MKNNKKGLSTIVATLLIILLTLVAVGIIWVVVKNVVQGGSQQVDLSSKCLAANVVATKVTNTSDNVFDVTLSRQGGNDQMDGVKLVFTNADGTTSSVTDVPLDKNNFGPLSTYTATATVDITPGTGVPNPNKVSVVVYFKDSSGNAQLCSTATQLSF